MDASSRDVARVVKVEPARADSRTIRELAIRTKTGVSIVILREDLCVLVLNRPRSSG
jgi:uncharacterized protein with PhoU and TrkA domain